MSSRTSFSTPTTATTRSAETAASAGRSTGSKLKCHLRVHLNGKIGGFGDIRVKGDLDAGPDHLVVLGGPDDFDGVAGKLTVQNTKKQDVVKYRFDLVR